MVAVLTNQHHHGLPPWHTVMTIGLLAFGSGAILPKIEFIDQIATMDTFSHRIFPELISLNVLIGFRIISCCTIFAWSSRAFWIAFMSETPTVIVTPYLPTSKLQRNVKLPLRGFFSHAPFTMWSWLLLGISFGLNGYLAFLGVDPASRIHGAPPTMLLRTAVILYEGVAPTTILVSTVVRYAMWPALLRQKGGDKDPSAFLKIFRYLVYHNLNVMLALVDACLIGGIPIQLTHLSFSVIFGVIYVVFSWAIRNLWNPPAGPQFMYFFLDTTLGYTTTIAILVLLLTLIVSHSVFCGIHQVLQFLGGGIVLHTLTVVLLCSLVCRFRD
jgi:hypothetical protein